MFSCVLITAARDEEARNLVDPISSGLTSDAPKAEKILFS
jgi:hypothetical protein